eukprot:3793713-Amphidinium_carterae.1
MLPPSCYFNSQIGHLHAHSTNHTDAKAKEKQRTTTAKTLRDTFLKAVALMTQGDTSKQMTNRPCCDDTATLKINFPMVTRWRGAKGEKLSSAPAKVAKNKHKCIFR